MKYYSHRRTGRGQVLVFVAIAIVAILGTLALATDVAIFYFNWAQLRKETDAAALAGASYLPDNPTTATSTASTWVQLNGVASDQIVQDSIGSLGINNLPNSSITVSVKRIVPYYFARVLGLVSAPVTVTATAGVQPISGASGWTPIAMPCTGPSCYNGSTCTPNPDGTGCYKCGDQVTLNSSQAGPGDWGALSCPAVNPGASGYIQAITVGCSTPLSVGGMAINSKPGNPVLTARAIDDHLATCSSCSSTLPSNVCTSPSSLDPSNPHVILLPLVDTSQYSGRSTAPVYGFAVAWILSTSGNTVTVEFITSTTSAGGTPSPTAPLSGAYAPVLLQ
ncbi:MAG TPA: Tad domain-containing protein [Candidatus Binataceae bacterium]|nr:Tad domain-containing protein [Candidatus Binataceae bacterium]